MAREDFKTLTCIFILLSLISLTRASCQLTRLISCATNFLTRADLSPGTGITSSITSVSDYKAHLDRVCSAYDETLRPCYDLNSNCPSTIALPTIVVYLSKMYEYVCYTGKEDMIKTSSCWLDRSIRDESGTCATKYIGEYAQALRAPTPDPGAICSYIYKSLTCIGDVVYNHCGKEAAAVFSTFTAYTQMMATQMATCPNIEATFGTPNNNPYKTGDRVPNSAIKTGYSLTMFLMTILLTLFKYAQWSG